MSSLPPSVRLFVATAVADGRRGPDSLMALVRDGLGQDISRGTCSSPSHAEEIAYASSIGIATASRCGRSESSLGAFAFSRMVTRLSTFEPSRLRSSR